MVLNMLRQNKIVMLVVMFLVMALAVWLLETFFGYSHLERYTSQAEILCREKQILTHVITHYRKCLMKIR